ncbi:BtrH N-terminal domain-containing protein [bacterium]|nr:BtrH N-terminal domain-containing protein [bacterium]
MTKMRSKKKMVSGFTHRVGVHCATTAFRNLFEYEGHRLSEDMCFGLGSGLGFTYWKDKRMPFPFVGGRTRDLEKDLCRNLGIGMNPAPFQGDGVKAYETRSRKKAYATLRKLILKNQPVIINVDLYYLPYFWGGQEPPPGAHFGGHFIVVAGIDEEKGVAYVADTNFSGLQEIKLSDLEEARDSKHKPFPPCNRWYILEVPEEITPLNKAIKIALTKNYQQMQKPPIKILGLKGMRYFAQDIVNWPQEIAPASLNPALLSTYIYMEEGGTGGGLFSNRVRKQGS